MRDTLKIMTLLHISSFGVIIIYFLCMHPALMRRECSRSVHHHVMECKRIFIKRLHPT